jgi:DNA-nicking Smr family endonuclease
MNKLNSFEDLKKVQKQLAVQRAEAEAREKAELERQTRLQAEKNLFTQAIGKVKRLPDKQILNLTPAPPPPLPKQKKLDDAEVMRESISDDFDVSSLLDTDDALSFRRPGISVEVTRRLRRGEWAIQGQLDLHGLRTEEARDALGQFIRESHKKGLRCLRVVHGKGHGSPGKSPVLKGRVQSWLVQKVQVLAFVQAKPAEGGGGALMVLLTPSAA